MQCKQLVNWLKDWFTPTEDLVDVIYPIGSIYMSVNNTSPQTLFGGTWVQLTDTFLYASNTADANSTTATGGEATHSLTQSEMPRHTHTQNEHRHQQFGNYSSGSGSSSAYTYSSNRAVTKVHTDYTTATNQYTGGSGTSQSASNGSAHNNMPPYMKVYMWKRTV